MQYLQYSITTLGLDSDLEQTLCSLVTTLLPWRLLWCRFTSTDLRELRYEGQVRTTYWRRIRRRLRCLKRKMTIGSFGANTCEERLDVLCIEAELTQLKRCSTSERTPWRQGLSQALVFKITPLWWSIRHNAPKIRITMKSHCPRETSACLAQLTLFLGQLSALHELENGRPDRHTSVCQRLKRSTPWINTVSRFRYISLYALSH